MSPVGPLRDSQAIVVVHIAFLVSTTLWEKNCLLISRLDACGLRLRGSAALRVGLLDSVTDVNQLGNQFRCGGENSLQTWINLFFHCAIYSCK